MNQLYFGDSLNVQREHIKDESVDFNHLNSPFNSKRDYNLLFKTPVGQDGKAGHDSRVLHCAFKPTRSIFSHCDPAIEIIC